MNRPCGRSALGAASTVALLLGACSESTGPEPPHDTSIVSMTVVDGAHGGPVGFYFWPPLAPEPETTGVFDASLIDRITVQVCALEGDRCGRPPVASFTSSSVETLTVDTDAELYRVVWRTAEFALDPATDYRVRVLLDGIELGFADVDLLPAGKTHAPGLVNGSELPIDVRVEEGVVDNLDLRVSDDAAPTGLVKGYHVALSESAPLEVDYWTDGEPKLGVRSNAATEHRVLLARLLPGRLYHYEIRADLPGRSLVTAEGSFTSEELPPDLAAASLTATGATTAALIMLEIREAPFTGFVAVDSQSRVVWHYRSRGASWSWARRANHNFVTIDTFDELLEITPGGEIVTNITRARAAGQVLHHDVVATPNDTFYFLTREFQIFNMEQWEGDAIWEWDPEADLVTQRWSAFDHLAPDTDFGDRTNRGDWLHGNALNIGVSGNVLLSSPFLSQVIAITPDFSALAWRMGGPNATITPDSAATFDFQHTAAEIATGRLLMFDNRRDNLHDGEAYSRALELSFDDLTATVAWQFRPPNDNHSRIISSARRMENGNTIVTFGSRAGLAGSTGPIEVYEVDPGGSVVWNLVVGGPSSMYRATPFDHIAGEFVVVD